MEAEESILYLKKARCIRGDEPDRLVSQAVNSNAVGDGAENIAY